MADSQLESDLLGLEAGVVRLRDYSPRWAEMYALEAARICGALGCLALDVQHVGSTAIPGIKAKPILDIAVAVSSLADLPRFEAALTPLSYEYAHWAGVKNDLVFGKGKARTHLLHIVERDGEVWRDYLAFKSALLVNSELARQYEALKVALSQSNADNRAAYTDAKGEFIRNVLSAA
ncbi:MAG: GrpB family protein [Bryobacteraceae bacterium]